MRLGRVLIGVALLIGCSAVSWAQSDSVPLGDVARQRPARKARRVITDDDLPPRPAPPVATADLAADNVSAAKPADAPASKPSDELATTRKTLEELLSEEQNLRSEVVNLKKQTDDSPADSRRDVLFDLLDRKTRELEETRAAITTTEHHLLELLSKQPQSAADTNPKEAKEAEDKPAGEPTETAAASTQPAAKE